MSSVGWMATTWNQPTMPHRAPHICGVAGCPELVRDGPYCPRHAPQATRAYDARRGSSARRGYGARWRRLREMYLRNHPICADPYGIHKDADVIIGATEVDHKTPRRAGGSDTDDNLQPLCKSCHSRKTMEEQGVGGSKSL